MPSDPIQSPPTGKQHVYDRIVDELAYSYEGDSYKRAITALLRDLGI